VKNQTAAVIAARISRVAAAIAATRLSRAA